MSIAAYPTQYRAAYLRDKTPEKVMGQWFYGISRDTLADALADAEAAIKKYAHSSRPVIEHGYWESDTCLYHVEL